MNAPGPSSDPQLAPTITRVIEWAAAAAISLGSLWAFLEKIGKPYSDWRRVQREHHKTAIAAAVRETLAHELAELEAVKANVEGCVERTERGLQRQGIMFGEHDEMLTIMLDNRKRLDVSDERIDEMRTLLDMTGFTNDRRTDPEQRRKIEEMLRHVQQQALERRRSGEEP